MVRAGLPRARAPRRMAGLICIGMARALTTRDLAAVALKLLCRARLWTVV